jgi:hypothetical protein
MPRLITVPTTQPEILAGREKILWEELRSLRDVSFRLLQWGVTVLASLQTAIFFLRKEVRDTMVASKELESHLPLPFARYLMGTLVLSVVAVICCYLVALTGIRYRKMRDQLVATNYYGIAHGEPKKSARIVVFFIFLAFPILDIVIRVWIHFEWK